MAATTPVLFNRVKETTTTTGTGTLTLAGAVTGFQSFAAVQNKGQCTFMTEDGTNWETAIGTYTASGTTLSRDTILSSSNSGAAVSWGAGSKNVLLVSEASQYGPSVFPPGPSSGWTWVNQGASTITDGLNGVMTLHIVDNATLNWRLMTKGTLPTAPYQVIAKLRSMQHYANSTLTGVYFYDGTKLMGLEFLTQNSGAYTLRVEKITNVTTDGSTAFSVANLTLQPFSGPLWVRLSNDATNLLFDISQDGYVWVNLFSEAVGTFITPTKAGFGGVSVVNATTRVYVSLLSWAVLGF